MTWRDVMRIVGVAMIVVSVVIAVAAWKLPIEAGGLVFAPVLLTVAVMCLMGGIGMLLPPSKPRKPLLADFAEWSKPKQWALAAGLGVLAVFALYDAVH